jgi:hypothetical protein
MNKKFLFSLMAMILLACSSITSPLTTATPIKQINDQATASSQPDEVAPSDTPTATVISVTNTAVATQEPGCDELDLTPEECATFGTHQYNLHGTVTGDCRYKGSNSKEDTMTMAFSFTKNKLTEPEGKRWSCPELTRTGENSFAAECNFPATDYSTAAGFSLSQTISFNDDGFVETKKETWVDKVSGRTMICNFTETYELIE